MKSRNVGASNPKAILNEQDVHQIIRDWEAGLRQVDLAEMYNVSRSTIAMITAKKSWRHIHNEQIRTSEK